ncbi:MAG: class I SAM-dependent methyltransferase [Vicinamibacterales bacterium]|nr:class I SAM-dependent methyltransferase [Vicinamibacterales bacterium]
MLEATFRVEQHHFWYRGFRRFVEPLLVRATEGKQRPRILDCGAGTGANLLLLEKYGVSFGVELTWNGLQFGRARGLTRLSQGTVAALPFSGGSIDVAVSFDVLYCLEDLVEEQAISEMFRVLKPGGALIVNVAALDMLKGDHSVLVSEVRRYTRSRLRSKLQRAGFGIERMTYTNAALFPITASVRALQRLRGVKPDGGKRGDFYVPPAPVNSLFSGALAVESTLIAAGIDMPVGSSVLCLARKN